MSSEVIQYYGYGLRASRINLRQTAVELLLHTNTVYGLLYCNTVYLTYFTNTAALKKKIVKESDFVNIDSVIECGRNISVL